MKNDKQKVSDNVFIKLIDKDGNVKQEVQLHNAVTTEGLYGLMDNILAAPDKGKPTHMAVGTGTPAANALGAQAGSRVSLTSKTRNNAVVTMVASFGAGVGTGTLIEAGVFNASTDGNMWLSATFGAITKGADDTLQITWTFTGSTS